MKVKENRLTELSSEEKKSETLKFLRAKWTYLHKQKEDVYQNQKKTIEELGKIVPMISMADLDIAGATDLTVAQYAAACFFTGLLDFKSGVIDKRVIVFDYRISIEQGSRIECGRRFGYIFGFEPRVSQMSHGADVTGFVMLGTRGLK